MVLALLGGFAYAALLAGGFLAVGWRIGFMAYMCAFAGVTLAAGAVLFIWIRKRGCAVFAGL